MDIVLGDNNGIDELRKLSKYLRGVPVIFVTGYTEYCQDIFIDFSPGYQRLDCISIDNAVCQHVKVNPWDAREVHNIGLVSFFHL